MKLIQQQCSACNRDAPRVERVEQEQLLKELPDWRIVDEDSVPKLMRQFDFKDFQQALAFTNRVGEIAEQEDHHPTLITEWGSVTLLWWTHAIGGLHKNDFIMAARSDALLNNVSDGLKTF